jgi:RecA-family ATPase
MATTDAVYSGAIASWRRVLEQCKPENRLDIFRNAASEVASLVGNGLDRTTVIDDLTGLVLEHEHELDVDAAQTILAEIFAPREQAPSPDDFQPQLDKDEQLPPLPYVNLATPAVDRAWLIRDCIPMFNVTLFSGDGAVGKSIALMQLAAATVLGKDWLGLLPDFGPVLYLAAEEDDDEIRRRIKLIAAHYGSSGQELADNGLRILCYAGQDATMGKPTLGGMIESTPLLTRMHAEAVELKPKLIIFDTVADLFGGKENDRTQTRQFITLMRGLAIHAAAALILASHPSAAGIEKDTGYSGSTAWHNSVRARLYFKAEKKNGDEEKDTTRRVLEIRKNNYGPPLQALKVLWAEGVFKLQPNPTELQQAAAFDHAETVFMSLLRRFDSEGRKVSNKPGPTFAPAMFADQAEAKSAKLKRDDFRAAMERLFSKKQIHVAWAGPASRQRSYLAEGSNDASNANVLAFQRLPTLPTPLATTPPHTPPLPTRALEERGVVGRPPNALVDSGGGGDGGAVEEKKNLFRVVGDAPAECPCLHCHQLGDVKKIAKANVVGAKSETLHEACAEDWFARMDLFN